MSRTRDKAVAALLDAMESKASQEISDGMGYLFLFLFTEASDPKQGMPPLVSVGQARELLGLVFKRSQGETITHVALHEMVRTHPRTWPPHPIQHVAQLIAPLIWEHHRRHGCVDKRLCPLSPITQLVSVNYLDIDQTPWLPRALEHLIATHPYRPSTFELFNVLARFPLYTPEIRSDVIALLRTVEATALAEILGAIRHSPWDRIIDRFNAGPALSLSEFHLLRRIGNRLIAAGDTSIIDAHFQLIDRYEAPPCARPSGRFTPDRP